MAGAQTTTLACLNAGTLHVISVDFIAAPAAPSPGESGGLVPRRSAGGLGDLARRGTSRSADGRGDA